MADNQKKLAKLRKKSWKKYGENKCMFGRHENVYQEELKTCPECNASLKNQLFDGANKVTFERLVAFANKGGKCPRPECKAQLVCPDCAAPVALNDTFCQNEKCEKEFELSLRTCPRCKTKYDRQSTNCPTCNLPSKLECKEGHPMWYTEHTCAACKTGTKYDWDALYPRTDVEEPQMPTGGFVITPYGPMYVFEVPAPKKPAPAAPVEEPEVEPYVEEEPVVEPKKRSAKAIVGLIFSILGILLPPLALIGIILGAMGRKDRKKVGAAAIVIGLIVLVLWAAAAVWAFLFDGKVFIIDLLKQLGLMK